MTQLFSNKRKNDGIFPIADCLRVKMNDIHDGRAGVRKTIATARENSKHTKREGNASKETQFALKYSARLIQGVREFQIDILDHLFSTISLIVVDFFLFVVDLL